MDYAPSEFPTSFDASLLKDKSVLITGGASGMGAAFARKFAEAGAFVTIADVNGNSGMALEKELTSANLGVKYVFCDVTSWKSQTEAFKTALSFSPRRSLDTVIAAAGIADGVIAFAGNAIQIASKSGLQDGEPAEPPEPPTRVMQVNLFGVFFTTQLAIYYMGKPATDTSETTAKHNNEKSIILVGSLAGYHAVPKATEYTASKYGVRGILKALRGDIDALGLRLNIIAPTYVATPMVPEGEVKRLTEAGVQFAKIETAVEAVTVLATHSGIHGRAICIGANGNFDLKDDQEGGNAGPMLKEYADEMNVRREKMGANRSLLVGSEKNLVGFF